MSDTVPVTIIGRYDMGHFETIQSLWRLGNPIEAVCDGLNVVASSAGHYAALQKYHQKYWSDLEYWDFDRLIEVGGDFAGSLMHGYYDRASHTFFWDYYYGGTPQNAYQTTGAATSPQGTGQTI